MGFLSIVRKLREKEKEMKLLIIGLDNAGKTTIIRRFNGEPIDTIAPTLGFDIKTLQHKQYTLNIWDIGGQQTIRTYWRNYFEVTDGLVWVVDSADRWRLDTCRDELKDLLQEAGFRVSLNKPFSGGFITRNYASPRDNIHVVQKANQKYHEQTTSS